MRSKEEKLHKPTPVGGLRTVVAQGMRPFKTTRPALPGCDISGKTCFVASMQETTAPRRFDFGQVSTLLMLSSSCLFAPDIPQANPREPYRG